MSVIIEAQPASEPVTIQEVKDLFRITTDSDDTLLGTALTSAREIAEKEMRRSLVYKGYCLYMDGFPSPSESIRVPYPPLIEVTSIKYLDSSLTLQTWDSAEYYTALMQEPGVIKPKPGKCYPWAACVPSSVEVHFKAGYFSDGYGDEARPIPAHFKLAVMQLAGHFYDHPEATSADPQNAVPDNFQRLFEFNKIHD